VFFEQAVRQGQEGVMTKHLASRYLLGKRSSCWLKIKPARRLPVSSSVGSPAPTGCGFAMVPWSTKKFAARWE
jgi:hypothetical protein